MREENTLSVTDMSNSHLAKNIKKCLVCVSIQTTMAFFDTTPLGRILNRFSSDLYSVDDSLPFVLNILLANIFGLLGMLVVISYGLPWVLVALLPLHFYRHTSRELKRLCSLTLSPIYSHFSETLTGLGTIRASGNSARWVTRKQSFQWLDKCMWK